MRVLSIWAVGDRYRLLLALARQDLGAERVSEILAPARTEATAILERGQREGVLHDQLPAPVLSAALEALTLSLLESVNAGAWEDDGTRTAVATRRAADYAHRLGYTVKTLTRACTAATGQPVKHVIDARVALEAQRLLAHTDEPVATIARRLGFPEPTNFGKFFTRCTGETPGTFRQTHPGRQ